MADPFDMSNFLLIPREVQLMSELFKGYTVTIDLARVNCCCEIVDHIKSTLSNDLERLKLYQLVKLLEKQNLCIPEDFEQLQNRDIIFVDICHCDENRDMEDVS